MLMGFFSLFSCCCSEMREIKVVVGVVIVEFCVMGAFNLWAKLNAIGGKEK